eukprot:360963-Chlamydomonas_euryale.AAC.6
MEIPLFLPAGRRERAGMLALALEWAPGRPQQQAPAGATPASRSAAQNAPAAIYAALAHPPPQAQAQQQQQQRGVVVADGGSVARAAGVLSSSPLRAANAGGVAAPLTQWHEVGFATAAAVASVPRPGGGGVGGAGPMHVRVTAVMDAVMHSALKMAGCRANKLIIEGPWAWLVDACVGMDGWLCVRACWCLRWVWKLGGWLPCACVSVAPCLGRLRLM